jgi:hypothetical protein
MIWVVNPRRWLALVANCGWANLRSDGFQNLKNREISRVGRKQAANTAGVEDGGKMRIKDALAA